jgi:hypothetical protein
MIGDLIACGCWIVIGIHSSCASHVKPLLLKMPLPDPPCLLGTFLCKPFNVPKHSVSLGQGNSGFGHQEEQFKIGSKFDSTGADSSEHVNKGSEVSHINNDSMTAVTNKLLNLNKCIPSTLKIRCGRAIRGLIIPTGSLADPRQLSRRLQ